MGFTLNSNQSLKRSIIVLTAAIGSGVGIIITMVILSHLLYHYYKLFINVKNKRQQTQRKEFHILAIIITIATFSICVGQGFLRSNSFTNINENDFTFIQCNIGYFLFWIGGTIAVGSLYILFIHRIQLIFSGTIYAYKPYVYHGFLIISMSNILLALFEIFRGFFLKSGWYIYIDINTNLMWCGVGETPQIIIFISSLIHFLLMVGLLYLFIRGLYKLNHQMMSDVIEEKRMMKQMSSNDYVYDEDGKVDLQITDYAITIAKMEKKEKKSHSVKKIIELHDLIKKQTVLAAFAIISTLISWLYTAVESIAPQLIVWDFTVNVITIWLMLGCSSKYWLLCRDYGICKIFYLNKGKTIKTKRKSIPITVLRSNSTGFGNVNSPVDQTSNKQQQTTLSTYNVQSKKAQPDKNSDNIKSSGDDSCGLEEFDINAMEEMIDDGQLFMTTDTFNNIDDDDDDNNLKH